MVHLKYLNYKYLIIIKSLFKKKVEGFLDNYLFVAELFLNSIFYFFIFIFIDPTSNMKL